MIGTIERFVIGTLQCVLRLCIPTFRRIIRHFGFHASLGMGCINKIFFHKLVEYIKSIMYFVIF